MQDLTIILFIMCVALFVARYFVKRSGMDIFTAIVAICGAGTIMQDTTIPESDFLIVLLPIIFIVMMSLSSLAFDKGRRY